MFVWTFNDVVTMILLGILAICLIWMFGIFFIAHLIEWFNRWVFCRREKGDKE